MAADPVEEHLAFLGRCNGCAQPLEEHSAEDAATCAEILLGIEEDEAAWNAEQAPAGAAENRP